MSTNHQTTQKLQKETKEVTELMQINVQKVVQRGENLDKLQVKSEELQQNSLVFKKGAKKVIGHDLNLGGEPHVVEKPKVKYDYRGSDFCYFDYHHHSYC